jgi:hypothetical protein
VVHERGDRLHIVEESFPVLVNPDVASLKKRYFKRSSLIENIRYISFACFHLNFLPNE